MNLKGATVRVRSVLRTLRLAMSAGAGRTLHTFDLLSAVHWAGLPTIELRELLQSLQMPVIGSDVQGVILHPAMRGGGSGSVAEMAALAAIAAAKKPRRILEIGTFDGCSAWHLLANSPQECTITTLDLPPGTVVEGSTDRGLQGVAARPFLPTGSRVRLVEVDSRHWQPDVAQIDLAFIDAGHSYSCVKNDTEKALSVMAPRGIMLWHDAAWKSDGYAVNQYLKELRSAGRDVRMITISEMDYCGLAMLAV
jgi:predicted O-methyltransferase YrrM